MKKIIFAFLIFMPFLTMAAGADADTALTKIGSWLSIAGQLLIGGAVVALFWGILLFIFDEGKREKAKEIIGFGIGGIFVMVSIWGIISFLQNTTVGDDASARAHINDLVPTVNK